MNLRKKLTRSHTSLTKLTAQVVNLIIKLPSVSKISLGIIKPNLKAGQHRIKALPITGGFRLNIRSSTSLQQIFVYTKEIEPIKTLILKKLKIEIKE